MERIKCIHLCECVPNNKECRTIWHRDALVMQSGGMNVRGCMDARKSDRKASSTTTIDYTTTTDGSSTQRQYDAGSYEYNMNRTRFDLVSCWIQMMTTSKYIITI